MKWENDGKSQRKFNDIVFTFVSSIEREERTVQCGVEFILATRQVLTEHPDCKEENCFQFFLESVAGLIPDCTVVFLLPYQFLLQTLAAKR